MGDRVHQLSISMNEEVYKLLEEVSAKLGYRNSGHTIESGLRYLESLLSAQENGMEVGAVAEDGITFHAWIFNKVKTVAESDPFFEKTIKCENCDKEFLLVEGMVYRESPEHEGSRKVECPNCDYISEF